MAKVQPQDVPANVSTSVSGADNYKCSSKNERPLMSNGLKSSLFAVSGGLKGEPSAKTGDSPSYTSPTYQHSSIKCIFCFSLYYVVLFIWLLVVSAAGYVEHRDQIKAGLFWVVTLFQFLALLTSVAFLFICRKRHVGFGIWGQMLTMIVFVFSGFIKETNSMRKANSLGLVALLSFLQALVLLLQMMVHRKRKSQLLLKQILLKRHYSKINIKKHDLSL